MKKTLIRLFTVALLLMVSLGARAEVKVLFGVNGTELQPDKDGTVTLGQKELTGGTVIISQEDQKDGTTKLFLAVTPDKGYRLAENGLEVYTVAPADISQTRTVKASTKLDIKSEDFKDEASKRTYTATIDSKLALWVKSATFASNGSKGNRDVTHTYYALHCNGNGYLRVNGEASVSLTNHATFYYGNIFSNDGSSLWVITSDGYLKNNYFYLNVANNSTLYLSIDPVTQWTLEDIDGQTKKHVKINDGTNDLYLCYDNKTIKLATSPSGYYNACPITLTEESWSGPTTADLTLQSPQLITYLRGYFTQKFNYSFVNDAGKTVSENNKERRVYATYSYVSGGSNKGTDWNITNDGIIYNMKASGDVAVTATYNVLPADPKALGLHPNPSSMNNRKFTIQQKAFTPTADMDYLFFSIKGGDDYRYPYDDGISENSPVKANGKGGTENTSVLSDPLNDGSGRNLKISWKITTDDAGFCMFKNTSTGRYLYFYEPKSTSESIGELRVGATTLPTDATLSQYKFRLYKTSTTDYSTCYFIIPYSKLFAIYKSDGIAADLYASLNITDYKTDNVIRPFKSNDNSKWCIYKYEAEYRVRNDFTFSGPASTDAIGNVKFTSTDGWYGKYIKESPKEGNGQRGLVVSGSYNTNKVNYIWTVIGLDDYIDHTDWTTGDGGYVKTIVNNKNFTFNVSSLPISTASGTVQLQLRGGEEDENSATKPYKWSEKKTLGFTILGNGTVEFTDISSLSEITSSGGAYRLTADVSYTAPGVTSFSGILDCNNKTISGLTAPLFTTLNNGTVRNLNLSGVDISSHAGPTGAIAGTATGGSRIYNVGILDGSVGSSGVCGGLVGVLDGSARVINCFSYANITSGTTVGGIVGENKFSSTASDIRTMVMNCMFYGDIEGGNNVSPVYGGNNINNLNSGGLSNFNYYAYDELKTKAISEGKYNCALAVEKKYLNRFEFYRLLLNSNKKLAAFYVTGSADDAGQMAKWVLETADRTISNPKPYPVLKAQGYYPSIINIDAGNAPKLTLKDGKPKEEDRKKGGKLGTLSVTIRKKSEKTDGGQSWPSTADVQTTSLPTVVRTDMDEERFNFNYDKIQLPYYNDVGTGNYTDYRVVTGWKIVDITTVADDPYTSDNYDYTKTYASNPEYFDYPNYNFANRKSSQKDLYSVSGRVFSQGAYFDVPYGVTSITIEPYWAKAAYIADPNYDVVYNTDYGKQNVSQTGTQVGSSTKFDGEKLGTTGQVVKTTISDALDFISNTSTGLGGFGPTVYDNAVVLVGNFHQAAIPSNGTNPFTMMSVDIDKDNEPDYSMTYHHTGKLRVCPIRFDFLNIPGAAQAQKPNGADKICNMAIIHPSAWFEITNTSSIYFSQLEYEDKVDNENKTEGPLILQGGVIDQIVSANKTVTNGKTIYFHIGGNVWFKEFNIGIHGDGSNATPHPPVSVTGGEYDSFYLTGIYNQDASVKTDNAECYISGGHFKEVAGAGQEAINGSVRWQIYDADIDNFFGGGTNGATGKNIKGDVTVDIFNSHVTTFCGGPKFGNMESGKKVTTKAEGCVFGKFFGAGYGGAAYSRKKYYDKDGTPDWGGTLQGYYTTDRGKYFDGKTTDAVSSSYGKKGIGVATDFDYEYFVWSSGATGGRFYVKFASFSLAQCNEVKSELTNCTINDNFYGGGSLGKVVGKVSSTLVDCTVKGNVFGAGFSATKEKVKVRDAGFGDKKPNYNKNSGMFEPADWSGTTDFEWKNASEAGVTLTNNQSGSDLTNHYIYTNIDLSTSNLGSVDGDVTLTITGTSEKGSVIGTQGDNTTGNVYGGGESSYVTGADHKVIVTLAGKTQVLGNVYGGGDEGRVEGSTEVNILEKLPTSGSGSGSGGSTGEGSGSGSGN